MSGRAAPSRPLGPVAAWKADPVRVLVVEDEQLLADAIARGLRREAMAVDAVYDGTQAWSGSG